MANLKNITELPLAESADGLNLIVNDNGAAKQIAAHEVGAQADWAEMDENSPAFIKNKPVEEWDLDLVCDIPWDAESSSEGEPVFTAAEGYSYDAFVAKIEAGEIPKVKFRLNQAVSADMMIHTMDRYCNLIAQMGTAGTMYAIFIFSVDGPLGVVLNSDGTFAFTA